MRVKLLTSFALITMLVGVALAWRSTLTSQSPEPIRVVINQLPDKDGVIPIEITQPVVSSSSPNKLEDLTYVIRNNSGKVITALAVSKTITYEEGGKIYDSSRYSMMDFDFHPDMPKRNFFATGTYRAMEAGGPMSLEEGMIIKIVTLRIDYVQYADDSSYRGGGDGERKIKSMREGARKYKDWLRTNYSRAGNSLTSILSLIQQRHNPDEPKFGPDESLGADRYRLYLLTTFQTRGAADVEKYFKN